MDFDFWDLSPLFVPEESISLDQPGKTEGQQSNGLQRESGLDKADMLINGCRQKVHPDDPRDTGHDDPAAEFIDMVTGTLGGRYRARLIGFGELHQREICKSGKEHRGRYIMHGIGKYIRALLHPGTGHLRIITKGSGKDRHQQGKGPGHLGGHFIALIMSVIGKQEQRHGAKGTHKYIAQVGVIKMTDRRREITFPFQDKISEKQEERKGHAQYAYGLTQGEIGDDEALVGGSVAHGYQVKGIWNFSL